MANELKHGDPGTTMTQVEFIATDLHVLNSQATGDLIYASSATQLSRMGITNDRILVSSGGVPVWSATLPAVTLGGTLTLGGQYIDAGATTAEIRSTANYGGFKVINANAGGNGCWIRIYANDATPLDNDIAAAFTFTGNNDTPAEFDYAYMNCIMTDVSAGSEDAILQWYVMNGGAQNLAMILTGPGVLSVDEAGTGAGAPSLFDEYDDALALRQGIQQNNRELLVNMGVLERKDTGSGYMMNLQPMVRLLAGGIYQTRQMLEDIKGELLVRLENVERKLLEN